MHYLTKESYTVDYAGFWLRLGALILDGIILWGLNYAINGIWNVQSGIPWSGREAGEITATAATAIPLWAWRILAFFIVQAGYFIGFWAWLGQTPGKMAARVRIVRFDGSRIGWDASAMRYVGYVISTMLLLAGFIWVAFDNRHQGWHDKIADTFVVKITKGK